MIFPRVLAFIGDHKQAHIKNVAIFLEFCGCISRIKMRMDGYINFFMMQSSSTKGDAIAILKKIERMLFLQE